MDTHVPTTEDLLLMAKEEGCLRKSIKLSTVYFRVIEYEMVYVIDK